MPRTFCVRGITPSLLLRLWGPKVPCTSAHCATTELALRAPHRVQRTAEHPLRFKQTNVPGSSHLAKATV